MHCKICKGRLCRYTGNKSCKQHATYIKKYVRNVYTVIPGNNMHYKICKQNIHANNMHYKICKGRVVLYTCNKTHAIIRHYKISKEHLFRYTCNQTSSNMQTCITTYARNVYVVIHVIENSSNMQTSIKNIHRTSMLLCMQNVIRQHANMHYNICKECIYHYTCNKNSSKKQTCILKYAKDAVIHYRFKCNKTCEHALKVWKERMFHCTCSKTCKQHANTRYKICKGHAFYFKLYSNLIGLLLFPCPSLILTKC